MAVTKDEGKELLCLPKATSTSQGNEDPGTEIDSKHKDTNASLETNPSEMEFTRYRI